MNAIQKFNKLVITNFTDEITDLVFQYILEHDELLNEYLDLVSVSTRQSVNSQLGKAIKEKFGVDNMEKDGITIKGNPKCVLIKTKYTRHKLK